MPSSFLRVVNPSAPCTTLPPPTELAHQYTFPLDPFQQHAIAAIHAGDHVLVTAKTGSGKTLVGEYLIYHTVARGGRVFYTTPIKSLSNQKFSDLKKMFGAASVGIMTGDIKFNPDAQIIVMTTEILRNLLYKQGTSTESLGLTSALSLKGLSAVVFDEVHYINDPDRGRVWEETMILLPPTIQMVLLSATIDRADLFASWIGELKQKPIHLISTTYRIVPLTHGVLVGNQLHTLMDAKDIYHDDVYRRWVSSREKLVKDHEDFQKKVKDVRRGGQEGPVDGKVRIASFTHQLNETIANLQTQNLLPALSFVFSRASCERYAEKVQATLIDASEAAKINHIWNFHLHTHKDTLDTIPQAHKLKALVERGIAYHHSGLLPMLKEIVEILFSRGFIKLLFATETFAVGLNMPTKTVLFLGLEKYTEEGLRALRTDEYIQMAGRAGRRGLDTMGTVIYLPERDPIDPPVLKAIMTGGRSPIISKMQFHYEFLLKSLQAEAVSWIKLMEQSYWYLQRQETITVAQRNLAAILDRLTAVQITPEESKALKERGEIDLLIQMGNNATKKKAKRELETWLTEHEGPRWIAVARAHEQKKKLTAEAAAEQAIIDAASNHTEGLQPMVSFLHSEGYLQTSNLETLTKESLTLKGTLSTEVNEGHSILMTELWTRGLCKGLSCAEVITVLIAFMTEGEKDAPSLNSLQIPKAVKECLFTIGDIACELSGKEKEFGVSSPPGFWNLSTYWIEPIWSWVSAEDVQPGVLCATYGLFEGNLMRAVLKASNLVDEWIALATFTKDTEVLDTMRDAQLLLRRSIAVSDSLYLRL